MMDCIDKILDSLILLKNWIKTLNHDDWIAIFTLALVIVGALQAYFLRRTIKATEIAANAAQKSADVLPALERAYLFTIMEDHDFPTRNSRSFFDTSTLRYRFKNYGRTPATLRGINTEIIISQEMPKLLKVEQTNMGAIVGQEKISNTFTAFFQITDEIITSLTKENKALYFNGCVAYEDIFGELQTRNFCRKYDFDSGQFVPIRNEYKI